MLIKDLLIRDPYRPIGSVVKITDHKPANVWVEMDEYVPTERVKEHFRELLDVLLETRRGGTERVCAWVSGFFGSGKSHFLKVLGYLLENRELIDPSGNRHSASEFLCRKLGLENFIPLLTRELKTKVLYINLLDYDPQSPRSPTISRLIYRSFLRDKGLSTEFWVAAWEEELQQQGLWDRFQAWVKENFGRSWQKERRLNAEPVLKQALPRLLPKLYRTEEEAGGAIQESKRRFGTINPSEVVEKLYLEAQRLDEQKGRIVVLLDEVGLYIGDSVPRLTDLNELAEQVVERGSGKLLLVVTAQEALPELVGRLTKDRQILEWLRDRFRLHLGLQPTEVETVVARRLMEKKPKAADALRKLYSRHQGALVSNLSLDRSWHEGDFVSQYPFPPYAVRLMQDIMGALRGSVEEARRLSGSERSMMKLTQAILTGEGGILKGAEQPLGWLVPFDLLYDALAPDLQTIRSDQHQAIAGIAQLGECDGLSIVRVAKALYLLQQLHRRIPCTHANLAAALVDKVDEDIHALQEAVRRCLQKLREEGWVAEEDGRYRLLTAAQHDLERDVRANYPQPSELQRGVMELLREMVRRFKYEHGQIRRPLKVAIEVDGETVAERGDLTVKLLTQFAPETEEELLIQSINEPNALFWKAAESRELKHTLERTLAIEKTLKQWESRPLSVEQGEYRERLEREAQTNRQIHLPDLMTKAFLQGRIWLGGREIAFSGDSLEAVLRTNLRDIAERLYTEFVDARPSKKDDCADILSWRPGMALPPIYERLDLLTTTGQINRDAGLLATVRDELKRRRQMGLDNTGKALREHFESSPYGWDPGLLRLLVATLLKAGAVGVRYHGRPIIDPTDTQVRGVFTGQREFDRAAFELLPEVDWREAAEKVSEIFAVPGGDTFERTAKIAGEQAAHWRQLAGQLGTRARDHRLPRCLITACEEASRLLDEVVQEDDPNARLRRFLESAGTLASEVPTVRLLEGFPFDEYRKVRSFADMAGDWANTLTGDGARRWQLLCEGLGADDLLDRWEGVRNDYAVLWSTYREDYKKAHLAFQNAVKEALKALRQHEAFQHKPEKAEAALEPLSALRCDADPTPTEEAFRCPSCRRSFASLSTAIVQEVRRRVEEALDALLPPPPVKALEPLSLTRVVAGEHDLEALAGELRRYWRKARRPLSVTVQATPKEKQG